MRINQNIAAFNAYRNLNQTQNQLSSSLEKLSSGFRINRAADDASGLVNSENLRSQIGGLKIATRNAQDAISLVQTAEGAQTEVHSILQRMRDLTVQSGNLGTNDASALRANQDEVSQLKEELTRIADQTQFGTKKILDGTMAKADAVDAATAVNVTTGGTAVAGVDDGTPANDVDASVTLDLAAAAFDDVTGAGEGRNIEYTFDVGGESVVVTAAVGADADATAANLRTALTDAVPTGYTVGGTTSTVSITADVNTDGENITFTSATAEAVEAAEAKTGAVFQVGANDDQSVSVGIASVAATELGTDAEGLSGSWTSVNDIDLSNADADTIDDALKILDKAIGDVSDNRATLGAFQNRMESTIRNVSVAVENLSAAESRIRDTDMAEEMVTFTRNQILQQAGTAMLAQANQVPQSVLSLLR